MYNSLTLFKGKKLSRPNSLTEKLSKKDKDFLFHPNTNLIAHKESGPFILERGEGIYVYAVSYTHLTLPTILLV